MGLAASQARLLSITSRMADNELRAQLINNKKMRLASESSKVSADYINALNSATMMITNYDVDGNEMNQKLTFNSLTAYSEHNTQYGLCDIYGNLLVSEEEAEIFKFADGDLNKYLEKHGLTKGTQYFSADTFGMDPVNFKDDSGNIYTSISVQNLKKMYEGDSTTPSYNETRASVEYNDYMYLINNFQFQSQTLTDEMLTKYYEQGGAYDGLNGLASSVNIEHVNGDVDGIGKFYYGLTFLRSNLGGPGKESLAIPYVALQALLGHLVDFDPINDNGIDNFGGQSLSFYAKMVFDDFGMSSRLEDFQKYAQSVLLDSNYETDTTNSSGNLVTKSSLAETVIVAYDQSQDKGDAGIDGDYSHLYYEGKIYDTSTEKGHYISKCKADYIAAIEELYAPMVTQYNTLLEEYISSGDFISDYYQAHKDDNPKNDNPKNDIVDTIDKMMSTVFGIIDSDSINDQNVILYVNDKGKQNHFDSYDEFMKYIFKNINNLANPNWMYAHFGETAYNAAPQDRYPRAILPGATKNYILNNSTAFNNVCNVFVLDQLFDTFGEPQYAWIDANDTAQKYDASAKAQWYTNLFNRMSQGYKALEDGLACSNQWIEYALESGLATMAQVNLDNQWVNTIYSNVSTITEVTDDAAVALAEAEYTREMNNIENKDKRYDMELKNIDTEHSALQTEYESIQNAMKSNIKRTFEFYKSA